MGDGGGRIGSEVLRSESTWKWSYISGGFRSGGVVGVVVIGQVGPSWLEYWWEVEEV